MFQPKQISTAAIPEALEKAERYRLLNVGLLHMISERRVRRTARVADPMRLAVRTLNPLAGASVRINVRATVLFPAA